MKRFIFIFGILMIIGLYGMAQIIQMQVQIYPQQVLANAPFKVFVSAYSTSGEPISFITATFNGLTLKATGSTASFDFIAPSITQAVQNFPVSIVARAQNGETFSKESTITVSINANPVIQIGKPIPSNNSYIGNTKIVKIPVKVYGGLGLEKVEFMVDTTIASVINVSPSATVYLSKTFDVDTTHLKNGWHIFSVKAVNIAGEIFSSISAYIIDIGTPTVNFVNLQKCLPANTYIPVNVTAVSTISGVANVIVNGIQAEFLKDSTWKATILTPDLTGPFKIEATAIDAATNKGYASFEAFSDGKNPSYLLITKDASMIRNNVLWGKYAIPFVTFVATTACRNVPPEVTVSGDTPSKISENLYNGYDARILTFEFPSSGSYTIALKVIDPVNKLSTSFSTSVSVAYYPLKPEIKPPVYPRYVGPDSTMTVSVLATDGQGIGIENVFVNDVKAKEVNGKWIADIKSPSSSVSGYHKFTVTAYDYLGNSSAATFSYYVDVNPPYISITPVASLYSNGIYWSRNLFRVNINVRTDSGTSAFTKVIVNQDPQIYSEKNFISIELTTAGTYTITVVSTNAVNGFSKTESVTYRVKFDLKNPEITGIDFPSLIGPSTPFTVKVDINDDFGPGIKSVLVNGTKALPINSTTWAATLISPDTPESKIFSIVATATDLLDLSSATKQNYFVDVKPPYIKIVPVATLFKDGTYWGIQKSYLEISATTDSKITPYSLVTLNGKTFKMTASSTIITIDRDGTYLVNVFSRNPVNNLSTSTSTAFKFAFDRIGPRITEVMPSPTVIGPDMALKVTAKVEDVSGPGIKNVYVNGKAAIKFDNNTWTATVISANLKKSGIATLTVKVVNFLDQSTLTYKNYFVDTEPPVIDVYLNGQKISNGSEIYKFEKATPTILVKAFTDGGVSPDVEVYLNNVKVSDKLTFAGIGLLNVRAVNPANMKGSTFEAKIAIFVDPKSPELEFYGPSTVNMTSYATFTLNVNGKDLRYAILSMNLNDRPLYFRIFDENGIYTLSLRKIFAGIEGKDVNVELKAVDMAGNKRYLNNTIYVDTIGPRITDVRIVNGTLKISFDKEIQGVPYVKLENLNGEVFDLGKATISSKTIIVNNVSIPYGPYDVIVNGITDNDDNPLMNNCSIWEF